MYKISTLTKIDDLGGQSSVDLAGPSNRRDAKRRRLRLRATTRSDGNVEIPIIIRNISFRGLLLETESSNLSVKDRVEINLPDVGAVAACVVWQSGPFVGCEFFDPISKSDISTMLLKSPPTKDLPTGETDSIETAPIYDKNRPIEPTINFSVVFTIALVLWALIAAVAYVLISG
jgi:hypothetical protein